MGPGGGMGRGGAVSPQDRTGDGYPQGEYRRSREEESSTLQPVLVRWESAMTGKALKGQARLKRDGKTSASPPMCESFAR